MTELLLIRHGETDWNLQGRYTGQSDILLNEKGEAQAQQLAEALAGEPLEAIYSSDLSRCVRTAELLAAATGAPLQLDARLREIDQGEWEGLLFAEIKARYEQAWERRHDNPLEVAPPGGETVGQVRSRVLAALEEILSRHPDGAVAIVSHGLALAIIQVHLTGAAVEEVWDYIPQNADARRVQVSVP